MKKILIVSNYSGLYGSEKSLINIFDALSDKFNVHTCLNESHAIPRRYLNKVNGVAHTFNVLSQSNRKFSIDSLMFWVGYLRENKFDVVLVNVSLIPEVIFAARVLGCRVIVVIRESLVDYKRLFYFYRKYLLLFSHTIVCNSKYTLSMFNCSKKIDLLYNTSGLGELDVNKDVVSNIDSCQYDFCYVGRISRRKGISVLLDAMRILDEMIGNEVHIAFVGEPKQDDMDIYNDLLELSRDLKYVRVVCLGFLENPSEVVSKSKFSLAPSILPETFGRTLLESYTQGVPVVSSDAGAYSELNDQFGLVYCALDSSMLARKLKYCLDMNEGKYHLLRNRCFRFSKEFSAEKFKKKLLGLLLND